MILHHPLKPTIQQNLLQMYQHTYSSVFNFILGRSISAPEREKPFLQHQLLIHHTKRKPTYTTTKLPANPNKPYHATSFQVQLQNTAHGGSALPPEAPTTTARGDTVTYQEQVSRVFES